MSDEAAFNLEEDGAPPAAADPAPPTASTEPTPPAAETPPQTEEPSSPDVEVDGQKMVPLAALAAERAKQAELKQQLQYLQAQQQAQQPFLDYLKQNPHLTQPPPAPAPVAPKDDPFAVEMAQRLALFRPDGSLDVDAGKRILEMNGQIVDQRVQAALKPMQQRTAQQQSVENYHRVLAAAKDKAGRTPDPSALQAIWQSLPPEYTADPQTANALGIFAFGLERLQQGDPIPTPPPVTVTETSGGLPQARPTLSPLGQKIAAERGRTEKQWADNMRGFNPKRPSTLED